MRSPSVRESPARQRSSTRAVFAALRELITGKELPDLAAQLPQEYAPRLAAPAGAPPKTASTAWPCPTPSATSTRRGTATRPGDACLRATRRGRSAVRRPGSRARRSSGGRRNNGRPAVVDLLMGVERVGLPDGFDVAVEVAAAGRVGDRQRSELEGGEGDVWDPVARALLELAAHERGRGERDGADRVQGEVRFERDQLDDTERVVRERAVAGVDRSRDPDLLARSGSFEADELRERGDEQ